MADRASLRQTGTSEWISNGSDAEKGNATKTTIVSAESAEEHEEELRSANRVHWVTVVLNVSVAILPLYFVGYSIAAFVRNDTIVNSFRNYALFQMAQLNPTIFPIVFSLIFVNTIKAVANWKLERGITVGQMQHLLGSRSLVSSITTPIKLRTLSYLVPVLVIVWALNPIGGQLSLRTISQKSNYTSIATPFSYADPGAVILAQAAAQGDQLLYKTVDIAFNSALISPNSSHNGTQDLFGNVHIPMLEYLQQNQTADADGWYYTVPRNWTTLESMVAQYLDVPGQAERLYVSLVGLPFQAKPIMPVTNTNSSNTTQQSGDVHAILQDVKELLLGDDVVGTTLDFTIDTSYVYADCRFNPLIQNIPVGPGNYSTVLNNSFPSSTADMVSNMQGFSIAYDSNHNLSSTGPRTIGVASLQTHDDGMGGQPASISQAWCNLTTTYVEADVHCYSPTNCTVARIRESPAKKPWPSYLTVLDGISAPNEWLHPDPQTAAAPHGMASSQTLYPSVVAWEFFRRLINTTSASEGTEHNYAVLSPLESYFHRPDAPYTSDSFALGPIAEVGDELFSRRMSQLINTYWLTSTLSSETINGLHPDLAYAQSSGFTTVQTTVLHCHKVYTSLLMAISVGLCGLGLMTAYLEATRRGPDVLDDFVNSLRHSPYVHENLGPTMEDGKDIVQRLKNTVVRMGDVRPDDPVGYVAIGTPNDDQRICRLDPGRKYV